MTATPMLDKAIDDLLLSSEIEAALLELSDIEALGDYWSAEIGGYGRRCFVRKESGNPSYSASTIEGALVLARAGIEDA